MSGSKIQTGLPDNFGQKPLRHKSGEVFLCLKGSSQLGNGAFKTSGEVSQPGITLLKTQATNPNPGRHL
ncbi:MAG: hypothetical protein Q8928_17515 [Bacteroidota bacterium]|nr:hypothetical protein [Bacteroidota bacterium]